MDGKFLAALASSVESSLASAFFADRRHDQLRQHRLIVRRKKLGQIHADQIFRTVTIAAESHSAGGRGGTYSGMTAVGNLRSFVRGWRHAEVEAPQIPIELTSLRWQILG